MKNLTGRRSRAKRRGRFSVFNIFFTMLCLLALLIIALFAIKHYNIPKIISDALTAERSVGKPLKNENQKQEWYLTLVNESNPLPEGYEITLTQLQNDQAVDQRIYPSLQSMFDSAREAGIQLTISSSYRTKERQQELLDEKVKEYKAQGYSDSEAGSLAGEWVALPGTSEHELGLAVDITTLDSQTQDAGIVWQWLKEHCANYGFILRYPEDKTEITGIAYEPWHFRYVGKEAAADIMEKGICFEEYLR